MTRRRRTPRTRVAGAEGARQSRYVAPGKNPEADAKAILREAVRGREKKAREEESKPKSINDLKADLVIVEGRIKRFSADVKRLDAELQRMDRWDRFDKEKEVKKAQRILDREIRRQGKIMAKLHY
ncbi:MAG: hypothetical protein ABH828_02485 [archaeon]